jgi:hypothetical protein
VSADGSAWQPLHLTGTDPAPGELVTLVGILGDGPDLVGLLHRSTRDGTVSTVFRQRVG